LKIHGELQKLGFVVSERRVARYLQRMGRRRGDPGKTWLAFPENHRDLFFCHRAPTVPDPELQRQAPPHAEWIVQQLREAFPEGCPSVMSSWIEIRSSMRR
jgi:hypothetical protein